MRRKKIKLISIVFFASLAAFGALFMIEKSLVSWVADRDRYPAEVPFSETPVDKNIAPSSPQIDPLQKSTTTDATRAESGELPPILQPINAPKTIEKKEVATPGPLYVEKPSATPTPAQSTGDIAPPADPLLPDTHGALNQRDIIDLTNIERAREGLLSLTYNTHLTKMAEIKARDMIARQYFAHVAPDGTDVVKLSEKFGYAYLNIGENLAMGDFISSDDVVEGWMNSPGHRANILNKSYTEIGVFAVMGNYNGRQVWYAVQEFGRPASACVFPNDFLEAAIIDQEAQIKEIEMSLGNLQAEIALAKDQDAYEIKVTNYNTIVTFYNGLIEKTKSDIRRYNDAVSVFNACLQ